MKEPFKLRAYKSYDKSAHIDGPNELHLEVDLDDVGPEAERAMLKLVSTLNVGWNEAPRLECILGDEADIPNYKSLQGLPIVDRIEGSVHNGNTIGYVVEVYPEHGRIIAGINMNNPNLGYLIYENLENFSPPQEISLTSDP